MITCRDAMVRAIQFADAGQTELAAAWVAIARELREGSTPRPSLIQMPGKSLRQEMNEREIAVIKKRVADSMGIDSTQLLPSSDQTVVTSINLGELCVYCGYQIELVDGGIRHTRTGQSVCPVPTNVDGTHTFATPDTSGAT